jgi:hypothetical protein
MQEPHKNTSLCIEIGQKPKNKALDHIFEVVSTKKAILIRWL